jgi:hypothetical protein
MREYLVEQGADEHAFVASAKESRNVVSLAARIRQTLALATDWAEQFAKWEDALRTLRSSAEGIGILVATSGVVGLNNHRPLDPQEFRGFVLCDSYAPLVFVTERIPSRRRCSRWRMSWPIFGSARTGCST